MKRILKFGSAFLLAVFLCTVLFFSTAHAEGGGNGTEQQVTVGNYTYKYYSSVYAGYYSGTPYANAGVSIRTVPSQTYVPAGWMYAQARLYTHSGALKATSVANTNSSSSYYLNSNFASLNPASAGTLYYGSGTVGFWNGSSYSYYPAGNTPSYQP